MSNEDWWNYHKERVKSICKLTKEDGDSDTDPWIRLALLVLVGVYLIFTIGTVLQAMVALLAPFILLVVLLAIMEDAPTGKNDATDQSEESSEPTSHGVLERMAYVLERAIESIRNMLR